MKKEVIEPASATVMKRLQNIRMMLGLGTMDMSRLVLRRTANRVAKAERGERPISTEQAKDLQEYYVNYARRVGRLKSQHYAIVKASSGREQLRRFETILFDSLPLIPKLDYLRRKLGYTVVELAAECGIHWTTVLRMLTGGSVSKVTRDIVRTTLDRLDRADQRSASSKKRGWSL